MATKAEIKAAALAIMKAEGWNYSGEDIMADENPRSRRWVNLAMVALKAAARAKRTAHSATRASPVKGDEENNHHA